MGNPARSFVRYLVVIGIGLVIGTAARAAEILVNLGFETGVLVPWFQDRNFDSDDPPLVDWNTTSPDAHTGTFSAREIGNVELRQNFTAIPTNAIREVSFWIKHPDPGVTAVFVELFYNDTTDTPILLSTTTAGWEFFDVTGSLEPGKVLVGFSIFGNRDGITLFDDARIAVPEPGTLMLLGTGLMGMLGCGWRRRQLRGS